MAPAMSSAECIGAGLTAAAMARMGTDVTDEDLQAACSEAYDSCMAEPTQPDPCTPPEGECTATVDEVEACINDSVALVEGMMAQFPACSELTAAGLMSMQDPGEPADPPSCVAAQEKCPSLM
jgi:hypothetical protein